MVHKPAWFSNGSVFVSYAETVGINKDGAELFVIDPATGRRTPDIDDAVSRDVEALLEAPKSSSTPTSRFVKSLEVSVAVPAYYDDRHDQELSDFLTQDGFEDFEPRTIGDLADAQLLILRNGHGSPSADMRTGDVPYIKVSDIRAGQININPSNRVPEVVARQHWKGQDSGLEPFDLITPIRTSKNIGEFAVLMPGQERVVLTKEVLVVRAHPESSVDNFFLLWALSLNVVRDQWKRLVFMQTNREDVGRRYREIKIPWTDDPQVAQQMSQAFRDYYLGIDGLRSTFVASLAESGVHHVFLGSPAEPTDDHDPEVEGATD